MDEHELRAEGHGPLAQLALGGDAGDDAGHLGRPRHLEAVRAEVPEFAR